VKLSITFFIHSHLKYFVIIKVRIPEPSDCFNFKSRMPYSNSTEPEICYQNILFLIFIIILSGLFFSTQFVNFYLACPVITTGITKQIAFVRIPGRAKLRYANPSNFEINSSERVVAS